MTNPTYRLLDSKDYERVKQLALYEIFPEYAQHASRNREDSFDRMMFLRNVDLALSVGVFVEDKMVAFVMMSTGTRNGKKTLYDSGGGVLPEYRGQGIFTQMFKFLLPHLKNTGFAQAFITVKPRSMPESAGRVCEKLGYAHTTNFVNYRLFSEKEFVPYNIPANISIKQVDQVDWTKHTQWQKTTPSWERNHGMIRRNEANEIVLEAHIEGQFVGYLIGDPRFCKLSWINVDDHLAAKDIYASLIQHFYNISAIKLPRMINIDTRETTLINVFGMLGLKPQDEVEELRLDLSTYL